MGELVDFIGCIIKIDLTKMTLKIYQPDLINKMTQVFNEDVKSLMTSITQLHQIRVLYIIKKQTQKYHTIYRIDTGVA